MMKDRLIIDFEPDRGSNNAIRYFGHSNGNFMQLYISEIDELGPRPPNFPNGIMINRLEDELKLLYVIWNEVNLNTVIFCPKDKLKQLYYRSKKFSIREGYMSPLATRMSVKLLKVHYKDSDLEILTLKKKVASLSKLQGHWNILHTLYLNLRLQSLLLERDGYGIKKGIYEIVPIQKKRKKDLLGYFDGV